ncbi:MAG: N-acetylmuramoyl-L-alanine amidase [Gemmatimonadetes bacterium]|nr:N-acetylmuramoyl-L-alanine amidase [Gemmatimonadota bacterium]
MILALALAALVQGAPRGEPPVTLRVVSRERTVSVPVVRLDGLPGVRADDLLPALGARLSRVDDGRWTIAMPGLTLDVRDGMPFAGTLAGTVPLAAPPRVVAGVLVLPLALATELIPRLADGVRYDAVRGELAMPGAAFGRAVADGGSSTVFARASRGGGGEPALSRPAVGEAPTPGPRAVPRRPAGGKARTSTERRIVVVDAGHGGPDRGMHGPIGGSFTIDEKDITLAVARRLADALRDRGVDVVLTRDRDTLIALSDRGRIANRVRGDLFLSIHVNAANPRWRDPGAARGFETYFLAEAKTEDDRRVERMENEAVRFETGAEAPKNDPLAFIINDMAQNEHLRESSDLAATVQRALGGMHPGPSRGVKQAGFRVLVTAYMPAVLIEIGFGTNPAEAAWMRDGARQGQIATSIADAAIEYLGRYERRVGTQP